MVTLHVAALDDLPDPHGAIREVLSAHGIQRLIELREFDESFERDLADTELSYDLSEGFWTSGSMQWMIYASHEASITFGGQWLIDAMRNLLPRFSKFIYKGWAIEEYDTA